MMGYVWKQWGFSQAKLTAFRRLITAQGDEHPLLELEYFRHGEDYLGQQYGTCGRSILSIGLPEKPDGTNTYDFVPALLSHLSDMC